MKTMKLSGNKTYIVGSLGVVWAFVGLIFGWIDAQAFINVVLASLGVMGLRAGVAKISK